MSSTKEISNQPNLWALDDLLKEIGRFGRYQVLIYALLTFPIMISGANSVSFVFTAGDLNYRCSIPECEDSSNTTYKTEWFENAIPLKNKIPQKCTRFEYLNATGTSDFCDANSFNSNREIECDNFVYETNEITLASTVSFTANFENLLNI